MIRVSLLGAFAIHGLDGEVILPTAKTQLMAAYLFWQSGRWIQRDDLRVLFWPDSDKVWPAGLFTGN